MIIRRMGLCSTGSNVTAPLVACMFAFMFFLLVGVSHAARAQAVKASKAPQTPQTEESAKRLMPPQIKIKNFRLVSVDLAAAHTELTLTVLNTSERALVVTAVDYKLVVKSSVIEGRLTQREAFPPKLQRTVVVPISLPFSSASAAVLEFLSSQDGDITYLIQGDVVVEGEPTPFHFEHSGSFSAGRVES